MIEAASDAWASLTNSTPMRGERSASVDAVRGVAILLVVAFHWFGMPFGWAGVDLFFVLSGYLIGGILIDNRGSPVYFRTFYARRIFRIVPLYLLFLIIAALTYGTGLPPWRFLTFTQNFTWAHTGLTGAGITGLTWSLAVEEQFYLILPILVRVCAGFTLPILSVFFIVLAPLCRWLLITTCGVLPYVMLPGRMDTLFAGVFVACIVRHPSMSKASGDRIGTLAFLSGGAFAGFAILGIAKGFSPGSIPMYLFGYSLLSVSFGCGLLAIVACEKPLAKHRILCAAGVGAYSIYLFHQVILSEALQMIGPKGPGAYLAALVGTIAAAIACWMLIERPFIRYARLRWDYGRSSRRLEISDHRRDVTRLSERRLAGTRGTDSEIFARFDR